MTVAFFTLDEICAWKWWKNVKDCGNWFFASNEVNFLFQVRGKCGKEITVVEAKVTPNSWWSAHSGCHRWKQQTQKCGKKQSVMDFYEIFWF